MSAKYAELLRRAFDAYLTRMDSGGLEPVANYLPFDFDEIKRRRWSMLGAAMVDDELCELTNILNHWQGSLIRWQAWYAVIKGY